MHDNCFAVKVAFLLKCFLVKVAFLLKCLTWIRVLRSSSFLSLSCDCFVELQNEKNVIFDENGLIFIVTSLNGSCRNVIFSQVCLSVSHSVHNYPMIHVMHLPSPTCHTALIYILK